MSRIWVKSGFVLAIVPWLALGFQTPARHPIQLVAAAWRKPDSNGRACNSCHSPDGFEIAAYNFSDADIMRRAEAHLSESESRQIVEMIHGIRTRYGIKKLLDPMSDRPMQPGGAVLPGTTPPERDAEFAETLPAVVPRLTTGRIDSLAAAKAARDQLLSVDLNNLRIGIPFNRLSEDGFHGKEHATIADWIPDVPIRDDYPPDLQDSYLSAASATNYEALDSRLSLSEVAQTTLAQAYSAHKRRALLYFTHQLRCRYTGDKQPIALARPNPLWAVGDFARQYANASLEAMDLPKDILAKKLLGPSAAEQLRQLRLSWMWLGWCMDPGLQRTSPFVETMRGDYFSAAMWADGPYPMHLAFMMTRKIATESFDPKSWNGAPPQHLDLDYSAFTTDTGIGGPKPQDAKARRVFDSFVANSFRMNLYLELDELNRTHIAYLRQALVQQVERMKAVLSRDKKDAALADSVLKLIANCKDGGRWRHGQA